MSLRNIHFQSAGTATHEDPQQPAEPAAEVRLRLRKVKLSPAEEYTHRAGQPRPISMALAACILSKSGKADVKPKGVLVDRTDIGRHYFWHADSRLCNDLSYRSRKIIYVYTALQPDIIHCLGDDGEYLETLPRHTQVDAFDVEASQAAHAAKARQLNRVAAHMQRIHQPDSDEALAIASRNAMEMQRVVQAMPAPVATPDVTPAPSPQADRMAAAAEMGDRQTFRDLPVPTSRHDRAPAAQHTNSRGPTAADLLLAQAEATDDLF
jgi:hypothetical protein